MDLDEIQSSRYPEIDSQVLKSQVNFKDRYIILTPLYVRWIQSSQAQNKCM